MNPITDGKPEPITPPDWWILDSETKRSYLTLIRKIGHGKAEYLCECGNKTIGKLSEVRNLRKTTCREKGCAKRRKAEYKKLLARQRNKRHYDKVVREVGHVKYYAKYRTAA